MQGMQVWSLVEELGSWGNDVNNSLRAQNNLNKMQKSMAEKKTKQTSEQNVSEVSGF